MEASSDSDSLVFAVASPPNGNTEAGSEAVHHAKEFMKTSATIQDFRRQNSYEKNKAKLEGGEGGCSKTVEWPLSKHDTALLW